MFRLHSTMIPLWVMVATVSANEASLETLEREFDKRIVPLIETYCHSCHDTETQEAKLDLTIFRCLQDVTKSNRVWETILERLEAGEMPPSDATTKPSDEERGALVQWIRAVRQFEATRHAGDPGQVLAHRLSNAEYDYSIRDLTGIDVRPTMTFPVDPANVAGFDNSGESLTMSPALMKKYLEAARMVVDHLVLTPRSVRFAPHPVVTDTDRDKYCVKRIVEFYQRQPTNYADYFFAAWSYRHRESLGKPNTTLDELANEQAVSSKYLTTIWRTLTEDPADIGPLAKLQEMWGKLPDTTQREEARGDCTRMRDYVVKVRKQFEPTFDNLTIQGIHKGSQTFVLWKNKQYAARSLAASKKRNCHPGNLLSGSALTPGPRRQRAACDSSVRTSLRVFGSPSASAGDTQRGTSARFSFFSLAHRPFRMLLVERRPGDWRYVHWELGPNEPHAGEYPHAIAMRQPSKLGEWVDPVVLPNVLPRSQAADVGLVNAGAASECFKNENLDVGPGKRFKFVLKPFLRGRMKGVATSRVTGELAGAKDDGKSAGIFLRLRLPQRAFSFLVQSPRRRKTRLQKRFDPFMSVPAEYAKKPLLRS